MFKIIKKNKNYKLIIGLIMGFIFSSSVVFAWYNDLANEVSYNSSNTWLHSNTVQGALDELAEQKGCPLDYKCYAKKNTLALGDYVSYTPSKTSYTTDKAMTGDKSTKTINPSELTLWRVIAINGDGTVDIISENVSTEPVTFVGLTGYKNVVGYLNVLASQYETAGITVGSRHFGYNGQTEFITDTQYFVNPAPWTCSTGGTCTPDPDDYESSGGGDTLYLRDYNLVYNVLGTRSARKPTPTGVQYGYWVATRYYSYSSATNYGWQQRKIDPDTGSLMGSGVYNYYSGSFHGNSTSSACLRPIVTLSSSLSWDGVGNKDYPMEIQ